MLVQDLAIGKVALAGSPRVCNEVIFGASVFQSDADTALVSDGPGGYLDVDSRLS